MSQKRLSGINLSLLIGFFTFLVCLSILFLALKVRQLEAIQKELAAIPPGTLQTMQGRLTLPGVEDYILGERKGKVTIIEYSDFECPSCQRMHPILTKIMNKYGKRVRLISRMFPLPQNVNAQKEAEAALCSGLVGGNDAFWRYGDEIYKRTTGGEGGTGFALDKLIPLSKELGLSEQSFAECLHTGKLAERVHTEMVSGQDAGIHQLPSMYIIDIHGKSILITGEQSFETIQAVLDQFLITL